MPSCNQRGISYITNKHGDIGFNDTIWDWWYSMMCSRSIYQTRCRLVNKLYIWMLLAAILGSKEQRTRHSTQLFVGHNWIAKCFVAKSSSFVVFPQKDQKDGWSIPIYTKISRKNLFHLSSMDQVHHHITWLIDNFSDPYLS